MLPHDEILNLAKVPQDQEKYRLQLGRGAAFAEIWLTDWTDDTTPTEEEVRAACLKKYGETLEKIETQIKMAVSRFMGDVSVMAIPLGDGQQSLLPGGDEFITQTFPR